MFQGPKGFIAQMCEVYTCSMETVQQNGRFPLFSSKFHSIYNLFSLNTGKVCRPLKINKILARKKLVLNICANLNRKIRQTLRVIKIGQVQRKVKLKAKIVNRKEGAKRPLNLVK